MGGCRVQAGPIPDSDCLLWQGKTDGHGYARIAARKGSRVVYELYHLVTLPRGSKESVIMHTCDQPLCVNPMHLRHGTQIDNMQDAVAKGRLDNSSPSQEVKDKISQTLRGRTLPEEHIRNISSGLKGIRRTPEWRHKISESLKGHEVSKETREKLSVALKGRSMRANNE